MRSFKCFPFESRCPICGTGDDAPCVLIPIDGTQRGNNIQAQPVHVECLNSDRMQYNRAVNIIYIQGKA